MGLTGADALNFIKEQQDLARETRQSEREEAERQREEAERQRESQREEAERQREEAERQRNHELELARLRRATENEQRTRTETGKSPKLPQFVDGTDSIDSYLERFERHARANAWPDSRWATCLSALLTGRALDVYSRLPEDECANYESLKTALLHRYNLNEEGYRKKFREGKPEEDENAEEFIYRLKRYFEKWVNLSDAERSYEGLRDLIIKEQVINTLPRELGIYIQERTPKDLKELAQIVEKYLKAHGTVLSAKNSKNGVNDAKCFICQNPGHKAVDCTVKTGRLSQKRCFKCNGVGHVFSECASKNIKSANVNINEEDDGKEEEIVECSAGAVRSNGSMPVMEGLVGNKVVQVLRDSGCNGVLVQQKLIKQEHYTGRYGTMILADKTIRKFPTAIVHIESPFYSGSVEVLCPSDAMYEVIIGNIPHAREPMDPDPRFQLNNNVQNSKVADLPTCNRMKQREAVVLHRRCEKRPFRSNGLKDSNKIWRKNCIKTVEPKGFKRDFPSWEEWSSLRMGRSAIQVE